MKLLSLRQVEENKQLLETIASNIRAVRKEKNITQDQLSELCGIKQSHISKIESGNQSLQLDTITTIASALNVPARQLLMPRDQTDLQLLEKLAQIEVLPPEERQAIERVIDMALLSKSHNLNRTQEIEKLKTKSPDLRRMR